MLEFPKKHFKKKGNFRISAILPIAGEGVGVFQTAVFGIPVGGDTLTDRAGLDLTGGAADFGVT